MSKQMENFNSDFNSEVSAKNVRGFIWSMEFLGRAGLARPVVVGKSLGVKGLARYKDQIGNCLVYIWEDITDLEPRKVLSVNTHVLAEALALCEIETDVRFSDGDFKEIMGMVGKVYMQA